MKISITVLPVCLLLLHGVTSADFNNNKRVPRRNTRVIRTYNANHPPILETYNETPVAVVYDDEEVNKVRNKNEKKADVEDEKKYLKYETSGGEAINLEIPPVNHPPSRGLHPFAGVDDYEKQLNIKPRAQSIKILETKSDETKTHEQPTNKSETRPGIRSRKRVQKVRKFKVDKSQLNAHVRELEMTENKEAQKEAATTTTDKTRSDEPSVPTPQTFKRRNGLPDPVVPIIELESYVFSHSGNFHYSYEGGDGTKAYERGVQKSYNGSSGSSVEGNYSYKDKDGNDVSLTYTADENGYRPVGAHLPTPPPIPPAIQRALAYLATKTTPEPITEKIKTLKTF